ncbi:MAG: hypothetical protein ACD_78C00408G0001, partial [uncultured bacterium (gcode 4)]
MERDHIKWKWRLELCEFVELIEDFLWECVFFELDHYSHIPESFRFVTEIRYSDNNFVLHELRDFFDKCFFVELIWNFRDNNRPFPRFELVDTHSSTHDDTPSTGCIRIEDVLAIIDNTPRWEVRTLDEIKEILDGDFVWSGVIEDESERINNLTEIMRWDIGRHTDSNPRSSIEEEIRDTSREDGWFLGGSIIIISPINRIFVNIGEHELSETSHLDLSITHRSSIISIHGTEVPLSIDEGVSHREILCHTNHCVIHGAIPMWVVFTENISDHTSGLTMFTSCTNSAIIHRIEDTSVNGFHPVANIWESTTTYDGHRIIEITRLHLFDDGSISISCKYECGIGKRRGKFIGCFRVFCDRISDNFLGIFSFVVGKIFGHTIRIKKSKISWLLYGFVGFLQKIFSLKIFYCTSRKNRYYPGALISFYPKNYVSTWCTKKGRHRCYYYHESRNYYNQTLRHADAENLCQFHRT